MNGRSSKGMMFQPRPQPRPQRGILDGTVKLEEKGKLEGRIPSTTKPYSLEIEGVQVILVYKGTVHYTYPESPEKRKHVFSALCSGDDWRLTATSEHGGTITLQEDHREDGAGEEAQ